MALTQLPGMTGSLFPSRFLTEVLADEVTTRSAAADLARQHRRFMAWWTRAAASCGPATGLRTLFDEIAMPLFGLLGYRARDASFSPARGNAVLEGRSGSTVALVLLPWSARPSMAWREAAAAARSAGSRWAFVLAPPYLSIVDARGHACRRALDVALTPALEPRSFPVFLRLAAAAAFDATALAAPIETLVDRADRFQDRVRADLQHGVIQALAALGPAVAQRENTFDETLTIVYRILFLLFAESRDLVPSHHPIYAGAYTVRLLCREAIAAQPATGAWDSLAAITRLSRQGVQTSDLIVSPFNGALFAKASAPSLEHPPGRQKSAAPAAGREAALRSALVALGSRRGCGGREEIAYADLGVEQLGAVYERVLDIDPAIVRGRFNPASVFSKRHSRRRKESGTFYTPQSLAEFVVRRTLDPLVAAASSDQILSLRVVDPAMGSGAFLVAACRFLASAYEHALIEEGRCAEADLDHEMRADIRRLIAERCIAGVDVNPVAVQLTRLSIWLSSLARGKPLGFLDHRLRVGNSLLGCSPDDLSRLSGRAPRVSLPLLDAAGFEDTIHRLMQPLSKLLATRDDSVEQVRCKEAWWQSVSGGASPVEPWRLACHIWCSRWFTAEMPSPAEARSAIDAVLHPTQSSYRRLVERRIESARARASAHRFFHWPLEFADIFYDHAGVPKVRPGFDAVIGNPPWEMVRRDAGTSGADVTPLIRFIRESGLYPSCTRGHVNLYQPFVDRALSLARPGGRIGLVVPWGVASDDGASALRERLLDRDGLSSIVGLDNANGIFPIHRGVRFLVVNATAAQSTQDIAARFGVREHGELDELPGRESPGDGSFPIRLAAGQLRRLGGPSRRIPDVRRASDYALLDRLTRAFPRLGGIEGWHARFGRELNATDDRDAFGDFGLPVLEGKHVQPFAVDAIATTVRIDREAARARLPRMPFDRERLAYRDVSAVGNRLSLIAAVLPAGVVTTHTLFCLKTPVPLERQHYLCGLFNSYVLNSVVRMLMGGHVTTSLVEDLPVPRWDESRLQTRRMTALARQIAEGDSSPQTMARLQAAAAYLYGLDEAEFANVLEHFPLIAESDRKLAAAAFVSERT